MLFFGTPDIVSCAASFGCIVSFSTAYVGMEWFLRCLLGHVLMILSLWVRPLRCLYSLWLSQVIWYTGLTLYASSLLHTHGCYFGPPYKPMIPYVCTKLRWLCSYLVPSLCYVSNSWRACFIRWLMRLSLRAWRGLCVRSCEPLVSLPMLHHQLILFPS